MNILHLTHTDINSDSRILKEMHALAKNYESCKIKGIGVSSRESINVKNSMNDLEIFSIELKSRKYTYLPKIIRHSISLVELTTKMVSKAIKMKPKVVHCHDTLVLPLGAMVKLFTGAKLIYDAHELESDRNGLTKILSILTLFVEKLLWRYIDALIIVSPSIEKWYKSNIGKKYSEIILNSPIVKNSNIAINKSYFRDKFSIPIESKIFLYIGILGRGRGIDLITDAFTKDGLKSHVVFLGYGELTNNLKALAQNCSNIHVHEAVPHEQVVAIAKSADVGLCLIQNVSLSDYYCLPNKLFEYCFAEIPVLASNFPDIAETVDKYSLGKCCELNAQSIYGSIKEFESMAELPKINSDNLYDLSWDAQEKKLIKLYASFTDNRKGN
jgi:glycosyltransferase involved in cell wall biosynthesis